MQDILSWHINRQFLEFFRCLRYVIKKKKIVYVCSKIQNKSINFKLKKNWLDGISLFHFRNLFSRLFFFSTTKYVFFFCMNNWKFFSPRKWNSFVSPSVLERWKKKIFSKFLVLMPKKMSTPLPNTRISFFIKVIIIKITY